MNKKEQIALLINDYVKKGLLEKWSEKYGEEYPDVFNVAIYLCPMKVVKTSDRYGTKEELEFDEHFEKIASDTKLYVMNLEDE